MNVFNLSVEIKLVSRAEAIADMYSEKHNIIRNNITLTTNINIYDVPAGAGISTPFTEDDKYTVMTFPSTDVPSNADCGVRISGDSMEPKYPDGSIVWVKKTQDVKYGDLIIATHDGSPYFKILESDGLHSINPDYNVIKISEDDQFNVFGKVISYYIDA